MFMWWSPKLLQWSCSGQARGAGGGGGQLRSAIFATFSQFFTVAFGLSILSLCSCPTAMGHKLCTEQGSLE